MKEPRARSTARQGKELDLIRHVHKKDYDTGDMMEGHIDECWLYDCMLAHLEHPSDCTTTAMLVSHVGHPDGRKQVSQSVGQAGQSVHVATHLLTHSLLLNLSSHPTSLSLLHPLIHPP